MKAVQPVLLIVDDEKNTREGLRASLEDAFEVYVSADIGGAMNVLERESVDVKICELMLDHVGEVYDGIITGVQNFGLFVQLDELYVEGLVHISELGGEYFRFDESRQELRGERTGIRYAIGTRVRIQVSRVDLDGRKIDFRLVRDDEAFAPRVRQRDDVGSIDGFKSAVKKAFTKVRDSVGKKGGKNKSSADARGSKGAGKSRRSRK